MKKSKKKKTKKKKKKITNKTKIPKRISLLVERKNSDPQPIIWLAVLVVSFRMTVERLMVLICQTPV
jgi:hypothetical protein